MSHERLVRSLAADVAGASLAAAALVGLALVAPGWLVGVACLLLVPVLIVVILVSAYLRKPPTDTDRYCAAIDADLDEQQSRRRDHSLQPGGYLAHHWAPQPAAATPIDQGVRRVTPPARRTRPDVVTAWVDAAWATHFLALHSYRVTRPGR